GYRLPDVDGTARVYLPGGTRWWNPLGGWETPIGTWGISIFHPDRPFVVSCHGPEDAKRFYIDIVRASTIAAGVIEYHDLYLDVMIDPARSVTEKDEHQLEILDAAERAFALRARDEVRTGIAASDPLFDPASHYFSLPDGASALAPVAD
ncbi:MAG TPA: DUF402 domain-containing protein, partial [Candidatus Limnocylindria bacterium]